MKTNTMSVISIPIPSVFIPVRVLIDTVKASIRQAAAHAAMQGRAGIHGEVPPAAPRPVIIMI
jgi:hypothetical protein